MDPWITVDVKSLSFSEKSAVLTFEDNFDPVATDKLPDSEEYLAALEAKLRKIKSDSSILQQLAERRQICMQQLLAGEIRYEDDLDLETPVANSSLLRTIVPEKQALTQGEVVEFIKFDQLVNKDDKNTID